MLGGKVVLVTGATGRLGAELVGRVEELGGTVVPAVLPGYPMKPKAGSWRASVAPVALASCEDLAQLSPPDYVINLHWISDRNLGYTQQLVHEIGYAVHRPYFLWKWLSSCSNCRFVNVSSINVFSYLNENPISASTEPRPSTPYGIAKLAAEKFFDAYFSQSELQVIHVRLCTVACFGEHPSQLMSRLCASVFEGERIKVNAGHTVYLLYVLEAVDFLINVALIAPEGEHMLAPAPLALEDIARAFEKVTGRTLNAVYEDLAPGIADPVIISDLDRLRAPWIRRVSLEGLISDYVARVRGNTEA